MTAPVVILLVVGGLAFIGVLVAMSLRTPLEYGPDEIVCDPTDSTVTTIARKSLVTHPFYEDGVRVAQAHTFGLGDTGIVLRLFEIETAQGRFAFAQLNYGKYALLRGDTVVGIAAMPLLNGFGDRWTSRMELLWSLPLETRVFLALLVKLEDGA